MGCEIPASVRPGRAGLAIAGALLACATGASAEPIRLRADAIAETRSPTGLVVLSGQDRETPWLDAEALVWAGTRPDATADVLVLSMRLREPHGLGEIRGGRILVSTGAIRPLSLDGLSAIARAPSGTMLEAFGGSPVIPRFGERTVEVAGGGRLSQTLFSRATLGVSYIQQRGHGEIANEELGADAAAVPLPWLDLAARGAYSLQTTGIVDASVSAAARSRDVRVETFATHRSPSRLLPATSLFSVLGDFPSQTLGSTIRWMAAPRLDLWVSGAAQSVAGEVGGNGWVRGLLRLDDRGDASVGLEVRRQSVSTARWTGARVVLLQPLGGGFRYSHELELAVPDEAKNGVVAWPWGLLALSWRSRAAWELAAAVEASSTPLHRYETTALARVSHIWESRQ